MTKAIEPSGYLKHILAHDEKVTMIVRQHWLVLFGRLLWPLFLCATVVVVVTGISFFGLPERPEVKYAYAIALLPLASAFWHYLVWLNQSFVMTSRRVIHMNGVFEKQVSDSLLEKLNDIKTDQTLLGRIFGYGDIEILTASEAGISHLSHIAKPLEFKRAMLDGKEELDQSLSHH